MKLLNKTIRSYLFYSITLLLVAIPLFYVVVRRVLLHAVDNSLKEQMQDIRSNLPYIHSAEELQIWSKMDKDIRLSPADKPFKDIIYSVYRQGKRHHEDEPYREISGTITVDGKIYALVISSSLVENDDLLGSILLVQSVLLILLMAGMLWINRRISQKIWRPFYGALDFMSNYELNKHHSLSFGKTDINEFNELNAAINQLTSRNYEVYLRQKEFTENASHEMQTPVAIFQSKIDLLMQTDPLSEEQAMLIASLEEVNLRLAKLNKSLLLLAKIENNQFPQTEQINLGLLMKEIVEESGGSAVSGGIKITEYYPSILELEANRTLIEVLISNLVINAIRHNMKNGEIQIAIEKRTLSIKNTGTALCVPLERAFDRFYKSGQHPGSVGLGLAIVKQICELYRYTISYQFHRGWHEFSVTFDQQ